MAQDFIVYGWPDDELSDLMPPSPVQRVVGVEGDFLQDEHGHLVVDHDLYNHEGLTEDGIAEAFIEFAKKEKLSFFEPSPSVTPFDAVRYQRLMDGLEAVEILFKRLEKSLRFDPEFYKKEHLEIETILGKKDPCRLGSLCSLFDGPFGSELLADAYTPDGIPILRMQNVSENGSLELDDVLFVSEEDADHLKKYEAFPGEVVSTKIGFLGYSTVLTSAYEKYIFRRELTRFKINKNIKLNPYYLATFFNSRFGRSQFYRYASGTTRDRVLLISQREILTVIPDVDFQSFIENIIDFSYNLRQRSKEIYQQAEDLLLSELGLKDWQPTEETVAVKSFAESFLSSGRFDAEYYQPKYDELLEVINSTDVFTRRIGDIQKYNTRGLQPIYSENGSLTVINSRHILEQHLDYENFERTEIEYWSSQEKARVYRNDILIYTTGANIGRTNVYLSNERALASNHVNILRLKEEDQIYVGFVINSLIGRLQTEKLSAGSAQAELYPKDIDNFVIPFIAKEKQEQVVNQYVLSLKRKQKSKQLLEIAKTGVERAIETDEATATTWINQQLATLGVDLT